VPTTILAEAFLQRFGREPEIIVRAPGRINLIGEHTDYNDGFVFPAAIDRAVWVAAAICGNNSELTSLELGEGEPFDAGAVSPPPSTSWTKYPAGMAWAIRSKLNQSVPNIQAAVWSNLPVGTGVSSSAAIEVAFATAYLTLCRQTVELTEIARLAQIAENAFVGMNCGLMDQLASSCGLAGHALLIDIRDLVITPVPMPKELAIVLCDTGKRRELTSSAYNERRTQCEEAARELMVSSLREANMAMLSRLQDPVLLRRARHVVSENARTLSFAESLLAGDFDGLGTLMAASHASLRDDFEVSCPELDAMVEAALESPGVIGCRMTGGGFGGACVALVNRAKSEAFVDRAATNYAGSSTFQASFSVCSAADGAAVVRKASQ